MKIIAELANLFESPDGRFIPEWALSASNGNYPIAMFIKQVAYFTFRFPDLEDGFWHTYPDWEEKHHLSRDNVMAGFNLMNEQAGEDTLIKHTKYVEGKRKLHWKLNVEKFLAWIKKYLRKSTDSTDSICGNPQVHVQESTDASAENHRPIYITNNITTKKQEIKESAGAEATADADQISILEDETKDSLKVSVSVEDEKDLPPSSAAPPSTKKVNVRYEVATLIAAELVDDFHTLDEESQKAARGRGFGLWGRELSGIHKDRGITVEEFAKYIADRKAILKDAAFPTTNGKLFDSFTAWRANGGKAPQAWKDAVKAKDKKASSSNGGRGNVEPPIQMTEEQRANMHSGDGNNAVGRAIDQMMAQLRASRNQQFVHGGGTVS